MGQQVHLGMIHSKQLTAGCLGPAHLAQASSHALLLHQHKVQLPSQPITFTLAFDELLTFRKQVRTS